MAFVRIGQVSGTQAYTPAEPMNGGWNRWIPQDPGGNPQNRQSMVVRTANHWYHLDMLAGDENMALWDEPFSESSGSIIQKALNLSVTYTAALAKQVNHALAVAATYTTSMVKQVSHALARSVTYTVTTTKQVAHALAVGATYAATLTKGLLFQKALSLTVTYTASLARVLLQPFLSAYDALPDLLDSLTAGRGFIVYVRPDKLYEEPALSFFQLAKRVKQYRQSKNVDP